MRRLLMTSLLVGGAALVAAQAPAQAPAPAAPAAPAPAAVPEQMPFDIPYGPSITLQRAMQAANAAAEEAKKHNWKLVISVVDPNGDLVVFQKMDGAQVGSIGISQGKARTAARFRRETRIFFNAMETGHPYVGTLDPTLVASPGGFPLIEGGKLIGAIGCSGGTGDQDAVACKAGTAAFM
jgi:glc operon protein GlcG